MKERPLITEGKLKPLYETKFLNMYDIQYAEGKHYFEATRRNASDTVCLKTDSEFKKMLPDAVTIGIALYLPNEAPKLLMSYEYRYTVGQFQLSPVAGLIDPEDADTENPLISAAIREIKEESGITVKETDSIEVINPCAFSSPGLTDESNAFLFAKIHLPDLSELNQDGSVGSELFDGFELISREDVKKIYNSGRDKNGNFYSLAAWAVMGYFLTLD